MRHAPAHTKSPRGQRGLVVGDLHGLEFVPPEYAQ